MANLKETAEWVNEIYQIEKTDPVVGGEGGISNRQAEQLANRTTYLKQELNKKSPLASPAFTGTPTAPTAPDSTNNTQLATTAWVKRAVAAATPAISSVIGLSEALSGLSNGKANKVHTHTISEITDLRFKFTPLALNTTSITFDATKKADWVRELGITGYGYYQTFFYNNANSNISNFPFATYEPFGVEMWVVGAFSQINLLGVNGKRYYANVNFNNETLTINWREFVSVDGNKTYNGPLNVNGAITAITPDDNANNTQLATTAWVRRLTGEKANLTDFTALKNLLVGIPFPYPLSAVPSGCLAFNGQTFNKTTYPELAKKYPSGRLPDLRGEFIRGWDNGRNVDAGRQLLSAQGDAIRNINGNFTGYDALNDDKTPHTGPFRRDSSYPLSFTSGNGVSGETTVSFDASRQVPTASENRPRNIAFQYICLAA